MANATTPSVRNLVGVENLIPAYEALSAEPSSRAVPDWLVELRQSGEARMRAEGLPTRSLEAWKYTNLAPLLEGDWMVAEAFADDELPARDLFPAYEGDHSGEIVVLNGRLLPQWSSKNIAGVTVRTSNEVEALPLLAGRSPIQAALNASLLRDVIVIDIKAGSHFKKPIVISTFSFGTESLTKWSASAPRFVINVGSGCEIALVEMSGGEGRTIHIPMTTINVAKGSRVSHVRLNTNQDAGVQLGYTQISLARDSFCETYQFTLGGRISREDLDILLTEPGAEALLDGLYLADGKRHVDHSTNVEHIAPHTTSSQLYKGILNDESRAVFNGRVHIHRDAQKSMAAQLNNNLILSKRAEIDTKPELAIDADDVKASHGATIGQIDPEHVFYLLARAILEDDAIKMLAKGFAQDVAFRIQNDVIRPVIEKVVEKRLEKTLEKTLAKSEALHGH
jgi:Fe-S cluster assembly protein SufD